MMLHARNTKAGTVSSFSCLGISTRVQYWVSRRITSLIINFSIGYRLNTFRWLLESPYLFIRVTNAFFAVSYDSSRRTRTARSRSLVSISSSRLIPLGDPSSLTSCTIRRTLWVNFPTKLEEAEPENLFFRPIPEQQKGNQRELK
uniref:(northern house mosquito) hypothetical protein n=1 Tax=Culex pipiens TaxID=7175 RepID=A0A8D8DF45_CULPI